ncbi:hypothetical protein AAOE16_03120 [Ekhidna sp. MALMAid0563]|uniref:hypothetical protein n=1 Tax=Ekhidna sp. MALMAid0563 TaxID=3143937 RepID=UPI0032DE3132
MAFTKTSPDIAFKSRESIVIQTLDSPNELSLSDIWLFIQLLDKTYSLLREWNSREKIPTANVRYNINNIYAQRLDIKEVRAELIDEIRRSSYDLIVSKSENSLQDHFIQNRIVRAENRAGFPMSNYSFSVTKISYSSPFVVDLLGVGVFLSMMAIILGGGKMDVKILGQKIKLELPSLADGIKKMKDLWKVEEKEVE